MSSSLIREPPRAHTQTHRYAARVADPAPDLAAIDPRRHGVRHGLRAEGLVVWVDALDGFPAAAVARERGLAGCGHGEDLFLCSGGG